MSTRVKKRQKTVVDWRKNWLLWKKNFSRLKCQSPKILGKHWKIFRLHLWKCIARWFKNQRLNEFWLFFQLQTCILKAIFFLELRFKCDENLQFSGVKTVKGNFPPLETYVARKWEEIFTFLFWMQRKKLKVFSSKFSLENQVTSFFRTFRLHFSWLF